MAPDRNHICRKIKELREKHRFHQEEVAERLNMSQNAYSELVNP
jgi:transcriptional regulator with XRE-family HTH domain